MSGEAAPVTSSGLVAMEVEVEADTTDDSVNRELCVLVNGSSVGCGSVDARATHLFTEQLLFPVAVLSQDFESWFSVELIDTIPSVHGGNTEVIQASTPPLRVRVQSHEDTRARSLLNLAVATSAPPSLSFVLTLTLRDLPRAASLFASLAHQLQCDNSDNIADVRNGANDSSEPCWLEELLVVVPGGEAAGIEAMLGDGSGAVRVVNENSLLPQLEALSNPPWDTYAVAMALKLLVATIVTTDYYVTLDADVLVTKRFGPRDLFEFVTTSSSSGAAAPRALFVNEPRSVHPHWWEGSAATLNGAPGKHNGGTPSETDASSSFSDSSVGFGVTPAVLSTGGALMTLASLREAFQQTPEAATEQHSNLAWVGRWLSSWGVGKWWSEYTLYALVLRRHNVFHHLHAASTELTCHSAWFAGDLPWDAAAAFRSDPTCFFAVVQSSSGADPSLLAAAVTEELETLHSGSRRGQPRTLASIFKQRSEPLKSVAIEPAFPRAL